MPWSRKTQATAAEVRAQALEALLAEVRAVFQPVVRTAVTAQVLSRDDAVALLADVETRLSVVLCNFRVRRSRRAVSTVWVRDRKYRSGALNNGARLRPINGVDVMMHAVSVTSRALRLLNITLPTNSPARTRYEYLAGKRMAEGVTPKELIEIVEWAVQRPAGGGFDRRLVVLWGIEATSYLAAARTPRGRRGAGSQESDDALTESLRLGAQAARRAAAESAQPVGVKGKRGGANDRKA